nr:hypothetical protein CFP56_30440 [Quercus suber]
MIEAIAKAAEFAFLGVNERLRRSLTVIQPPKILSFPFSFSFSLLLLPLISLSLSLSLYLGFSFPLLNSPIRALHDGIMYYIEGLVLFGLT